MIGSGLVRGNHMISCDEVLNYGMADLMNSE
nr:MAG TPA: Histone-lysine N-methyltransferase SUVR4 [Caudoviricetes sp.]